MFYENELRFLCDTLKKSRLKVAFLDGSLDVGAVAKDYPEGLFGDGTALERSALSVLSDLEPHTLYKYVNELGLKYVFLLLPKTEKRTVLLLGPYFSVAPSKEQILEIGEKNGVSPKRMRMLEEYYSAIPVLPATNSVFIMLDSFCELIWKSPAFSIVDVENKYSPNVSPINESSDGEGFNDAIVNMKAMEQRYAFENELMRAVTLGQMHKEEWLKSAFSDQAFEQRLADPLRNAKNYGIIMNTLLRKAAEKGGVHPVYLDRVSSEVAAKIEQMTELSETGVLMCDIFRSYCRLVRKYAMKKYSLPVQKTVMMIDTDLSAELSLSALARAQGVSAAYLSSVFKKETGKTVSEYIRGKRVEYAAHLLETTNLQVQTVALHCGIIDVQYFSKIFKRQMGKTPKEYRETQIKV